MIFPQYGLFYFDQALSLFGKVLTEGVMPLASIAVYVFTALGACGESLGDGFHFRPEPLPD